MSYVLLRTLRFKTFCYGGRCPLVPCHYHSLGTNYCWIGDGRGCNSNRFRKSTEGYLRFGLVDDLLSSYLILKSPSISWRNGPISIARTSCSEVPAKCRRPRFVVLGELYMTDDSILVQGYNDKWRKQRKILHQALVPRAILKYKPIQDAESKRLLWDLYKNPTHFEIHLNRYELSVRMAYLLGMRLRLSCASPTVEELIPWRRRSCMK